jgi:hypothetical protein
MVSLGCDSVSVNSSAQAADSDCSRMHKQRTGRGPFSAVSIRGRDRTKKADAGPMPRREKTTLISPRIRFCLGQPKEIGRIIAESREADISCRVDRPVAPQAACPSYRIRSNNQTLADAHSRSTDRGPMFRMAAISSTDNPPK